AAVWELGPWRRLLGRLGVWWGAVIVLIAVVPLFAWVERASAGQFSREFLWHHNVERGLGGSTLRSHPWPLYLGYLLLNLLPSSPLLPAALLWRGWRGDATARLGFAWLAGVMLLLSGAD